MEINSNIVSITVQMGTEPCKVDVEVMHETLLQLPAEKYLELYHMMKDRVENRIYSIPKLPPLGKGGILKDGIALL